MPSTKLKMSWIFWLKHALTLTAIMGVIIWVCDSFRKHLPQLQQDLHLPCEPWDLIYQEAKVYSKNYSQTTELKQSRCSIENPKIGVNFFKFIIFNAALSDLLVQLKDSFNKVETILNLFEVIFDPQAKLSQC